MSPRKAPSVTAVRETTTATASIVASAEVQVARLREQAEKWRTMAEAKAAAVVGLEVHIGGEVLAAADDDATAEVLAGQLAKARAERDTALATGERAEQQIESACRQRLAAVADDLRTHAAEIQAHSVEHEQRVTAILAELARLDGVTYVPPTGAITRTQAMCGQVAELHGKARILDATATGEHTSRSTTPWRTAAPCGKAHVTHDDRGDDASVWADRVLATLAESEQGAA
jgi:hypothetical protein